jgi:ubiquinone/menaquinone biosynthesis C-methylase UbiE
MDLNPIAIRMFDAWAEAYDTAFMDTSLYHASFDRFLAALTTPNAEVLELGCGPGNITQYLLSQRPDLRMLGTDLAPWMLELARANNPKAEFRSLDASAIKDLGRSFDGLVCGFCLHYLTPDETNDLIRDAADFLHPGGVLYISTIEGDPALSGFKMPSSGKGEAAYIHYYQASFLTSMLEANGFRILDLSRASYTGRDGMPTSDLLLVALR